MCVVMSISAHHEPASQPVSQSASGAGQPILFMKRVNISCPWSRKEEKERERGSGLKDCAEYDRCLILSTS